MAHLLEDISKHFVLDEIDTDNWTFKLYYKVTSITFMIGSLVGVASQYFGEPIQCDFKGVDGEMASDYCWIHGSSYIPPEYQAHMLCIVDQDGVHSADDAPDTSYYQWVTFMMLIQSGLFMLPSKIWKSMEGGLIKSFNTLSARSAIILKDEDKLEGDDMEGAVTSAIVEKYVKYFKAVLHHNNGYFFRFVICEILNYILLVTNLILTDKFLQGRFLSYGWDVIQYYQKTPKERRISINPFCATFPTEVSCTVPTVGAAGGAQEHNGLCVLSQNVINEKIYLFIWFWMAFLTIISFIFFFYRCAIIFFPSIRTAIMLSVCSHKHDKEVNKSVRYIMSICYVGDWFLLYQLRRNTNLYFFREFMKEMRNELREKPKRSRSMKLAGDNHNHNKVSENTSPASALTARLVDTDDSRV